MKKFWSFCALFPDLFPSSPVPTSEFQLMMFVSWLAQSLSPASVDVYLAPVRSYHIDWGYSGPTQNKPRLRRVLQGIHLSHGAAPPPLRRPITCDILCSIHRILSLPNSGFDSLMFWSACSLAFFGFLRVSLRPPLRSRSSSCSHRRRVFAGRTFPWTPSSHQVFQNRSGWRWSLSLHRCYRY